MTSNERFWVSQGYLYESYEAHTPTVREATRSERHLASEIERLQRDIAALRIGDHKAIARYTVVDSELYAAHVEQQQKDRQEVERLRRALERIQQASLTWAMACQCPCEACDEFYDAVKLERTADGPAAIPTEETTVCQSRWHTSSGPEGGVCPMCNKP